MEHCFSRRRILAFAAGVVGCVMAATLCAQPAQAEENPRLTAATHVSTTATVPNVAVHRLFNAASGEHLYTTSASEVQTLVGGGAWSDEGVGWYAPRSGATGVYRLYNPYSGSHLYTSDLQESTSLAACGWSMDNGGEPLFHSAGDVPILRLYNPYAGVHLITKDTGEYDTLSRSGWSPEGIKFSGMSTRTATVNWPLGDADITNVDSAYSIAATVNLNGRGTGYEAKLVADAGDASVSFGLRYDDAAAAPHSGATAFVIENLLDTTPATVKTVYAGYGQNDAAYRLLMTVQSNGVVDVYVNGVRVKSVANRGLADKPLDLRVESAGKSVGDLVNGQFDTIALKTNGVYQGDEAALWNTIAQAGESGLTAAAENFPERVKIGGTVGALDPQIPSVLFAGAATVTFDAKSAPPTPDPDQPEPAPDPEPSEPTPDPDQSDPESSEPSESTPDPDQSEPSGPELADSRSSWRPFDEGIYAITTTLPNHQALDVFGASSDEGANVDTYAQNDTASQKWKVTFDADGHAKLETLVSGKVLTAESTNPGANVTVRDDHGASTQRWAIEVQDDGTYTLISQAGPYAVDVNGAATYLGANVDVYTINGTAAQRFEFQHCDPLQEGIYTLMVGPSSNLALDVADRSTAPGANVQVWSASGGQNQKWMATQREDGTYTFESLGSGLVLTAGSTQSGANVYQDAYNGGANQRFLVEPLGGGTYQLRLKDSDCVIDLSGASFADGANIQIWTANNSDAQRMRFVGAAPIETGFYTIGAAANPGVVWDVCEGSIAPGANYQLWGNSDGYAQTFQVTRQGDGTYRIGLCETGNKAAPVGGSAGLAISLEQASGDGGDSGRWLFQYAGNRSFIVKNAASGLVVDATGGQLWDGTNLQLYLPNGTDAQRFVLNPTSAKEIPYYHGFQNPAGFYQVSDESVWFPHIGEGIFGYRTASRIGKAATKSDCIEAMIGRAYEYLGTDYVWDYACAPYVGVDCAGLVLQALYATGMDLSPMNPWDHFYTPGHDHYAVWMYQSDGFLSVPFSARQRGDLIFYSGHVAIYLGNDMIIDAYPPCVSTASVYSRGTIIGVGRPFI